jgi:O-antigen/teichoic acid export membrane protein
MSDSNEANLVGTAFWLFLDGFLVSFGAWFFWLIISFLTSSTEIGYATTAVSFASLIGGILGFGMDYSLLRYSSAEIRDVYSSAILLQGVTAVAMTPMLVVLGTSVYGRDYFSYMVLASVFLVSSGLVFASRFSFLGLLRARLLLLVDALGVTARIACGILFVWFGFGGIGILAAYLVQSIMLAAVLVALSARQIGFMIPSLSTMKLIAKHGLGNFPFKISTTIVTSLSVILLAAFTSNPTLVAVFYIALMVSVAVAGFSISLATMAIPAAASAGELSSTSLRMGLCMTAPVVTVLVIAPNLLLGLIGKIYMQGASSLIILSLALFPITFLANIVAKLNHTTMLRELALLGSIQLGAFLLLFAILVRPYADIGVSLAILGSGITACVVSLRWATKAEIKSLGVAITSVACGWAVSQPLRLVPLQIIVAVTMSALIVIVLRGVRRVDLQMLIRGVLGSRR